MIKHRLPKTVSIMGTPFRVLLENPAGDGKREYGETAGCERTIKLNPSQTADQMHATRLHEYVHAVLHCSGLTEILDDKLEEAIAVAIEHGLAPLIKFK